MPSRGRRLLPSQPKLEPSVFSLRLFLEYFVRRLTVGQFNRDFLISTLLFIFMLTFNGKHVK